VTAPWATQVTAPWATQVVVGEKFTKIVRSDWLAAWKIKNERQKDLQKNHALTSSLKDFRQHVKSPRE